MGGGAEEGGEHGCHQHQEVQCREKQQLFLILWMFNFGFTSHSDKKRKLDGGNAAASNGTTAHGKLKKKEMQQGKFKKNKDKRGKFGQKL